MGPSTGDDFWTPEGVDRPLAHVPLHEIATAMQKFEETIMNSSLAPTAARFLTATVFAAAAITGSTGTAFAADNTGAAHPVSAPFPHAALATTNVDAQTMASILAKHNNARDEVKVGHLSWDDGLATDAQRWADALAAQGGPLSHDDPANADHHEGENLGKDSPSTASPANSTDRWYAEKAKYDTEPNKTTYNGNPNFASWGHYSQMVWAGTTKIGCGTATSASGRYTSCRYSVAGNTEGQLAYPGAAIPAPLPPPATPPSGSGVHPEQCAYNPGGRGGYGSYVDGLALDQRDWEQDLANAINAYRAQNRLPSLAYSRTLARPAMWASLDSYNRGSGSPNGVDSRGMNSTTRVKYCSGYTGYLGEVSYSAKDIGGAKWQRALDSWKRTPDNNRWLLDRQAKVFAVGMAYGGNDTDRVPAYYTVDFGDH
jgi:uncharacterized protein YkwD